MRIIYGIDDLKRRLKPSVVSVGIFDGVHIGHKLIIKELIKKSRSLKAIPTIVTFDPHPVKVLNGKKAISMLSSLEHRLCFLKELGIKCCIVLRFNRKFSKQSSKDFIKNVLIEKLRMKALVIGEDFSFGNDRLNSVIALNEYAKESNFAISVVALKRAKKRIISSSAVRRLIEQGELRQAERLLDKPVSILGTVIKGVQRGRELGFRTANIDPHHEAIPPSGVYAVYVKVDSRRYKAVLNIGKRPTFKESEPSIEVHIFGLNRNLYGKDIVILFHKRLRPEKRFDDQESLSKQIRRDVIRAKKIL